MKRTIALSACALALVLTGCGSGSDTDDAASNQAASGQSSNSASSNSASQSSGDSGQFASENARRSYALGMDIGNSLKDLPMDLDLDQLTQGVRDVVGGGQPKLSQQQLESVMSDVVSDMQSAQQQQQEEQAQSNMQEGQNFLEQNRQKEGVQTLDSGLQYKVLQEGDGPSPDANDSVTVTYTGRLIDGTVFDSSDSQGQPVTFPVNAVIPGWTQALQLMRVGGEYKLFIPPDLAYGERGAGAQIGPNETLIFDVKLISVDENPGTGENSESNSGDNADSGSGS